jgi:hypothetical protein
MVDATSRSVAEAIEQLYAVFAGYPLARHVVGCPCCVDLKDNRDLHAAPLRELTAGRLEHFAFDAFLTWGTEADFKHFLPRLLELTTGGRSIGHTDLEVTYAKLTYADWNNWPDTERKAVDDFLRANWLLTLSVFPPAHENTDAVLCALGRAVDDLTPYLRLWEHGNATALRHLADMLCEQGMALSKGRLRNGFWHDRHDQMRQVLDWLRSPTLAKRVEDTYFASMDDPFASELSFAVQILESLQQPGS